MSEGISRADDEAIQLFQPRVRETALPEKVVWGMAVAAIGLLATGAFAFHWFAPDRIPPAASSQPFEAQGDTFNELTTSSISRAPLLQAKLFPPMRVSQVFSGLRARGQVVCMALSEAGFKTSGWQMAALFDKDVWECGSGVTPIGDAPDETDESNLFLMLRGSSDGTIQNLHLKLNLLDPKADRAVLDRARKLFHALETFADISIPKAVVEAVSQRRPMSLKTPFGTYRFAAEMSDARRFNLVATYFEWPRSTGLLGMADRRGALDRTLAAPGD